MGQEFAISLRMKDYFFDRQAVRDRIDKKNRKALAKAGAFIRRRAKSSLRRRKKASSPGQPPSVHTSDRIVTLKNILFALEPERDALVIGPVKLNQKAVMGPDVGDATVPQIHEFGATVKVREVKRGRRGERQVQVRTAHYPARPFMGPALESEREHIPDAWSRSL